MLPANSHGGHHTWSRTGKAPSRAHPDGRAHNLYHREASQNYPHRKHICNPASRLLRQWCTLNPSARCWRARSMIKQRQLSRQRAADPPADSRGVGNLEKKVNVTVVPVRATIWKKTGRLLEFGPHLLLGGGAGSGKFVSERLIWPVYHYQQCQFNDGISNFVECLATRQPVQFLAAAVRQIGITELTYYRWWQEYGGLKLDQVMGLNELEPGTGRLRLVRKICRRGFHMRVALPRSISGWACNDKQVERVWWQEGLKVPLRQLKRSRIRTGDGASAPLRAERPSRVWRRPGVRCESGSGLDSRRWRRDRRYRVGEPAGEWLHREHTFRLSDELLKGEIFSTLAEARIVIENWRRFHNIRRPQGSAGYRPPAPEVFIPQSA